MSRLTDADLEVGARLLRGRTTLLTIAEVRRVLGHEKGPAVMRALAEAGIAPVIERHSDVLDEVTYHVARDVDEVREAAHRLQLQENALRRRREGLMRAFLNGGLRQPDLFGGSE